MGRKHAPQPLTLSESQPPDQQQENVPRSAETLASAVPPSAGSKSQSSPRSPRSPFRFTPRRPSSSRKQSLQLTDERRNFDDDGDEFQQYPPISSALHRASEDTPPRQHHQHNPISPGSQHRLDHPSPGSSSSKPSKGGFFFNFAKASNKSSHSPASSPSPSHHHHHQNQPQPPTRQNNLQNPIQNPDSRGETMSRGPDSAPMSTQPTQPSADASYAGDAVQKPAPTLPSASDVSIASAADYDPSAAQSSSKKSKSKPFGLLSRNKSLRDKDRDKDGSSSRDKQPSPVPITISEPEPSHIASDPNPRKASAPAPASDRSIKEMVNSTVRNRSEDRGSPRDMASKESHKERGNKESQREKDHHPRQNSSSQNGGFFGGLKSGRDMISNRLFGKGGRSGSTTEREPVIDDEHYVLKTINLPLVEQTRRTRISKRLEDSRDKTEFWMPAFPWRAIDYLNYKGCDVEGLYRVPGSGPQIKKWQRRFDEEYDVNLFEQPDLYDINIIGSMLKAWLRELPDELFPKEAQERVARECVGYETVPPLLVEELSNLSPFNYYLLFAITCHLSLLLAHSDKNKMDFRNLCICFQPCMKIDAFCFRFLVCDWRDCWKGCKNEAKYIEQEYQLFDQPPPKGLSEPRKPSKETTIQEGTVPEEPSITIERAGSSSDNSSKHSNASTEQPTKDRRLKKKPLQLSESNGSVATNTTASTNLTIDSGREPRGSNDLRPLSPIKPLSPLGF